VGLGSVPSSDEEQLTIDKRAKAHRMFFSFIVYKLLGFSKQK
jgi:hypothetical protein